MESLVRKAEKEEPRIFLWPQCQCHVSKKLHHENCFPLQYLWGLLTGAAPDLEITCSLFVLKIWVNKIKEVAFWGDSSITWDMITDLFHTCEVAGSVTVCHVRPCRHDRWSEDLIFIEGVKIRGYFYSQILAFPAVSCLCDQCCGKGWGCEGMHSSIPSCTFEQL